MLHALHPQAQAQLAGSRGSRGGRPLARMASANLTKASWKSSRAKGPARAVPRR
jgi:hypothetical protein